MSERISSLIDGELENGAEIDRVIQELIDGSAERERWDDFHLIGDVLRAAHGPGLRREAFAARLAAEPTVLAPRRSQPASGRVKQWPLRIAASVAVIAFVGWVAQSFFDSPIQSNPLAGVTVRPSLVSTNAGGIGASSQSALSVSASVPVASSNLAAPAGRQEFSAPPTAPAAVAIWTNTGLDDYVWAHQRYSPASLIHDVAPYVRLISGRGPSQ